MSQPTILIGRPESKTILVVLSNWSDVAAPLPGATHDHAVRDRLCNGRVLSQGHGHVGQGTKRDQRDLTGKLMDGVAQDAHRVVGRGRSATERQSDVAHAILPMHKLGRFQWACQRCRHTAVHRYGLLAQLHRVEGILHALVNGNVAGNDRDGLDVHIRILHGHD
jgi:hypothetical protein